MQNLEIMAIVNAYTAQKGKDGARLPAAVAWKRRVNIDKLFQAKKLIDDALRDISAKYADDEHSEADGDTRKVKPEYMAEFVKEQGEILAQETDVDVKKVKIEELGDIALSDEEMDTLAFMIEEGE